MDQLASILRKHVTSNEDTTDKLLGAAFVVVNKDGTVQSASAGRTRFDTSSPPFGLDSFSWMASVSKIITCTCLMQVVERGRITLDEDIRGLFKELAEIHILHGFDEDDKPILEPNVVPITLRHLLTHTAGMGIDIADGELMKWSEATGRKVNIMNWSRPGWNYPLRFAPGSGWYYGVATDWAGLILEHVTGQKLSQYMQENVFDPLGMHDTGFWPEKLPQVADRTTSYSYRKGSTLEDGPDPTPKEHEEESGGGGLFSTPGDYAKFFQGLLSGKLVKEDTFSQFFTPQLNEQQRGMLEMIAYQSGLQDALAPEFPAGHKLDHGLAGVINVEDVPGKRRKGSIMWSGANNQRWWIDRESGIACAFFCNLQPHGDAVVKQLIDELERAVYKDL